MKQITYFIFDDFGCYLICYLLSVGRVFFINFIKLR
jgi:hypothetical protein